MRIAAVVPLGLMLALAWPGQVSASPGCYYPNGDWAMNCGPATMPPGWRPPLDVQQQWRASQPPAPSTGELLGAFAGLAALFALIALMPRFDGRQNEDWLPPHKDRA